MRWLLVVWMALLPLAALATGAEEDAAALRSVWLSAKQLPPALSGLPLDELSLARWQGDRFEAIPFQFDEVNRLGLVYFDGELGERDGLANRFDGKDLLGFMWQDAGGPAPVNAKSGDGKLLADIRVSLPGLDERHVYLLRGSKARSERHYVEQSLTDGTTRTPYYRLEVEPDSEITWHNFHFRDYRGAGSIVDSLRMRMSGRFLGAPRVTLDNENLRPKLLAVKAGPIRTVMLLKIYVVVLGIPVMTIHEQVSRYASRYQAITYTHIPGLYKASLMKPSVQVSIVGNRLLGGRLVTQMGGSDEGRVDGQLDEAERKLLKSGIDNRHNWLYFDSRRNFIVMTRLDIPDELKRVPVSLVYDDQPGEGRRPPLLPNVGYAITAWPDEKEMLFGLDLLFDNTLHGVTPGRYLELRVGEPSVQVTPLAP